MVKVVLTHSKSEAQQEKQYLESKGWEVEIIPGYYLLNGATFNWKVVAEK